MNRQKFHFVTLGSAAGKSHLINPSAMLNESAARNVKHEARRSNISVDSSLR
jgi:hypothetical protein